MADISAAINHDHTQSHGDAMSTVTLVIVAATAVASYGWRHWLHEGASLLADVTTLMAFGLAAWAIYSKVRAGSATGDDAKDAAGKAGKALEAASKAGGKLAIAALVVGAVAMLAALWGSRRADAAPVPSGPTMAARRRAGRSADDADGDDAGDDDANPCPDGAPPWMQTLWADIGTHEVPGKRHNPRIVAYFRDAGFPSIRDDETAWCAAAVNASLERAGIPGSKSLAARSFEKWGAACEPKAGCIVVLWRGSRTGWQGHVGLLVRKTSTHVHLLGGNQGDALNVQAFPVSRVLAYRWPREVTESRIARAGTGVAVTGTAATTVAAAGDMIEKAKPAAPAVDPTAAVQPVQDGLQGLVPFWRPAALILALLTVALGVYTVWRRMQDHKERGV